MKKVEVKHDTTEYKIPIEIRYNCRECLDRQEIVIGQYDDIDEIPCPFCTYPDED